MSASRKLPWDWYEGTIPENVQVDETAYIETSFSFSLYRSTQPVGASLGHGASAYLGTMFDVGPQGKVTLGDYTLVHGARIICDSEITIGDYSLISWNVVLMDNYRLPSDPAERRASIHAFAGSQRSHLGESISPRPISIGSNVWIGFNVCVLPGVTIGEGSIVGARSVVAGDVPPYTIVAGNPARIIRHISSE